MVSGCVPGRGTSWSAAAAANVQTQQHNARRTILCRHPDMAVTLLSADCIAHDERGLLLKDSPAADAAVSHYGEPGLPSLVVAVLDLAVKASSQSRNFGTFASTKTHEEYWVWSFVSRPGRVGGVIA